MTKKCVLSAAFITNINDKFRPAWPVEQQKRIQPPDAACTMKKTTQRRPTMTDIAKLTGVSQSTVSLVLNNATGAKFSETTRNKVLKAAHDLGYRLSPREPVLASGDERNLIVYLADEISTSPHPVVNIDGARDAAYASGKMLAVYSTHGNADIEKQVLDTTLSNPHVFGVIYATVYTRKVTLPAALSQVPTVLLNCYTGDSTFSSVVPAEVAGGHLATEYLLQAGHRRISYINGEPWQDASKDRLKGYRTALATADLPFAAELVRDGDWSSGLGFELTLSLMRDPNPPTAIFCANAPTGRERSAEATRPARARSRLGARLGRQGNCPPPASATLDGRAAELRIG